MIIALALLGCQEYNLQGPPSVETTYNPPDLAVAAKEDHITQVTVPSVDVLFVVDNSGSMSEEQAALRANFDAFMRYFTDSGMDYHVGVVSTDMDNRQQSGRLIDDNGSRYIDNTFSEANAIASFKERANLGTMGSSEERGKDASYTALVSLASSVNAGFYREEAVLSIVVISDERDWSKDVSIAEYSSWMQSLKPEDDQTWFSSIVGQAPNGCATAEKGVGYLEVTDAVGGIKFSICEPDYSSVLDELGMQAAGLKREFFLSEVPVEDTIIVSVTTEGDEDTFKANEWTYDGVRNSVTFNSFVPDPLAIVNIIYEPLADAHEPDVTEGDTAGEE